MLHLGTLWPYPQTLETKLERLARDKHSSLLRKSVFYDTDSWLLRTFVIHKQKKFYNIGYDAQDAERLRALRRQLRRCQGQVRGAGVDAAEPVFFIADAPDK